MTDRTYLRECMNAGRHSLLRARAVRPLRFVSVLALLSVLSTVPWYCDFGVQRLLVEGLTLFAVALAWNLLAGYGGMVAIGLHLFIGVGSYSLFTISNGLHLNPWACLPIAVACSAVAAAISAWPMFRLSGAYFAVGTWVLAELAKIGVLNTAWLGAGAGMPLDMIGEFGRWSRNAYTYWSALAVGAGSLALSVLLLRSRLGLALMSIRDSEVAALASGVSVNRTKLALWVFAASITGAAGSVSYISTLQVTPDASFSLNWTASAIFIVILGGIGTIEGPIIGTIVYFTLRETFAGFGSWYFIGLGSLAIFTMIAAPGGAWSLVRLRSNFDLFGVRRRAPQPTVQPGAMQAS